MLALGVKPYIASTFPWSAVGFYPHLADRLQGAHGTPGHEPNLEQLAQLEPDLIIISGTNEKVYGDLNKIAPTVLVKNNPDWRVTHRQLANAVGKSEEAEKNLKDYDAHLTRVRDQIRTAAGSETVLLAVVNDEKTVRVYGQCGHALNELIYKDLGLKPAAGVPTDTRVEVSLEGLSTFDPDHIFMQKNRALTVEQVRASVNSSPVWSSMRAVKNNRLYISDNLLAMSWGPMGRGIILDWVRDSLSGAK